MFRAKSGYTGTDIGRYAQPGSNGLTLDPQEGRLTICRARQPAGDPGEPRRRHHGAGRSRTRGSGSTAPTIWSTARTARCTLTDPPFGLPKVFDDPDKELAFSGVFAVKDGELLLIDEELEGPNGLAFSPDER